MRVLGPVCQNPLQGDWLGMLPPVDASSIRESRNNLRDVIPAGKGRIDTAEYLSRIRNGQNCGIQSMLRLINTEYAGFDTPSQVAIIGGGPSLQANVGELRRLLKRGVKTLAVNKSHDWLIKRGLRCDYATLLDPKEWVADYVDLKLTTDRTTKRRFGKDWVQPKYLIASQCHDVTLDKFKGRSDSYLWHAGAGLGEGDILKAEYAQQEWCCVPGASVVGLRGIPLAHGLGFRVIHLFGIDGSAKPLPRATLVQIYNEMVNAGLAEVSAAAPPDSEILNAVFTLTTNRVKLPDAVNDLLRDALYSYDKPKTEATWKPFTVELNTGWTRSFMSNHHMARAVYEFEDSMREWDDLIKAEKLEPFRVVVHGDPEMSAIAMVAAGMGCHADPAENEKYGKPPEGTDNAKRAA